MKIGGEEAEYRLYVRKDGLNLEYNTTNKENAEKAAGVLRRLGYNVEVKTTGIDHYVQLTTEDLGAGPLRDVILELINRHESSILASGVEKDNGVNKEDAERRAA